MWVELDRDKHARSLDDLVRAAQLEGVVRITIIMRQSDDGWKIFQYHESRQLNLDDHS